MKQILYVLFLSGFLSSITGLNAQEKLPWKNSYYKYKISHKSKEDTIPSLFCLLNLEELRKYHHIYITYNDKVKKYSTKNILKDTVADCKIEDNMVYFRINRSLSEPFVIMTGEDYKGQKYKIYEHNDRGELIDPAAEREKWVKAMNRLDSIEYVRSFDNVFIGKDGKPRHRDRNGKVHMIDWQAYRKGYGNRHN
ncbi:MAG: hypothetical protein JXB00_07250 [Bacteroidales bacterium]|nr:hypothetical protein [Bacteroidales bacterium]